MISFRPFSSKPVFPRGIHPSECKGLAAESPIEVLPAPKQVQVPLLQHTGAACSPTVEPRAPVLCGDLIGEATALVSAAVHASISGKVLKGAMVTLPNGRRVESVAVKQEGEQLEGRALFDVLYGGEWPVAGLDQYDPSKIVEAVKNAGIVGLGGAAFPTHVKLLRNPERPIQTLVLNGCECEPYLTADYRLMVEAPAPIIAGALLSASAAGASSVVVAIEDNKPAAVEQLREAARGTRVKIKVVQTKYPMGSERQLVPTVLGCEVPSGGLPLDVGVVVMNVATAAAVARAVIRGEPLTHRIVTVSGTGIRSPKNLLVPIGTSYSELISFCGGMTDEAARVVAGGPMMGFTLGDLETPVTKGTSGITVLTARDVRQAGRTVCVRCGRCVDVCPQHLVPTKLAHSAKKRDWDLAKRHYISACMECGCCAFACPSGIPLVQMIRAGKAQMPRNR